MVEQKHPLYQRDPLLHPRQGPPSKREQGHTQLPPMEGKHESSRGRREGDDCCWTDPQEAGSLNRTEWVDQAKGTGKGERQRRDSNPGRELS